MVQGVFAPAHIQGVAVSEEGHPAPGFYHLRHGLGEVGPQVGEVPGFAEVDFNGDEFLFHIDFADAGGVHELFQLI